MAIVQTAGREALGEFAPEFAHLNDDVLFGEVWNREDKLSLRDCSLVTVTALMAQGLTDSSFQPAYSDRKLRGPDLGGERYPAGMGRAGLCPAALGKGAL